MGNWHESTNASSLDCRVRVPNPAAAFSPSRSLTQVYEDWMSNKETSGIASPPDAVSSTASTSESDDPLRTHCATRSTSSGDGS